MWIVCLARTQCGSYVVVQGVLGSGQDLRRAPHVIGEIDLSAPTSHPWSTELCLVRIGAVIGKEKLNELLLATTPKDDLQFCWSAAAAQSIIQRVVKLMVWLLQAPPIDLSVCILSIFLVLQDAVSVCKQVGHIIFFGSARWCLSVPNLFSSLGDTAGSYYYEEG